MTPAPRAHLLIVAATAIELEWVVGAESLIVGLGPVEAALATARRLAEDPPELVLHLGIAGARRASGVAIGSLVIGTDSRYTDLVAQFPLLVASCLPDGDLFSRVCALLPRAARLPIATSAAVGGGAGMDVEAMEGFGVLRAAEQAGIPAVELRAISNFVEETDRSRWDIGAALAALADAGRTLEAGL